MFCLSYINKHNNIQYQYEQKKIRKSKPLKFNNHRKPPRPVSWESPRGNCRFCGGEIIENGKMNKRKNWHQSCANLWRIMNNPTEMKRHVFLREKGICQECGFLSPIMKDFDADHIKPLFEAFGDPVYYEPDNVQLLCKRCHKEKTKDDMKYYHNLNSIKFKE